MTVDEISTIVLDILRGVAPELDAVGVRPDLDLREQLDIDSMDFLNFVIGVHERFGVDIPETDYERLETLDSIAAYVAERLPQ